jgi:hypothetical protein
MNIQYYLSMDDEIPTDMWIHFCARRLKLHWRTVDPQQLEELAADLACDARLRALSPQAAATLFLEPVTAPEKVVQRS